MQISKRLEAVASFVEQGSVIADVGCDHGYIPIYLYQKGMIPKAIAMDVNKGPLERAEIHIREYGLGEYITTRLSDGVCALKPNEADAVVIAGMGGALMEKIIEEGEETLKSVSYLILQPQSEIQKVRKYLRENDFKIIEEKMVFEDGKYYPMMKAVPSSNISKNENKLYDRFGEYLLETKNPVLEKYLKHQLIKNEQILKGLFEYADSQKIRISELTEDRNLIMQALDYWK